MSSPGPHGPGLYFFFLHCVWTSPHVASRQCRSRISCPLPMSCQDDQCDHTCFAIPETYTLWWLMSTLARLPPGVLTLHVLHQCDQELERKTACRALIGHLYTQALQHLQSPCTFLQMHPQTLQPPE